MSKSPNFVAAQQREGLAIQERLPVTKARQRRRIGVPEMAANLRVCRVRERQHDGHTVALLAQQLGIPFASWHLTLS